MKQLRNIVIAATIILVLAATSALAQSSNNFLVRADQGQIQAVCQRYGLTMIKQVGEGDVYLVSAPAGVTLDQLKSWMAGDPSTKHVEKDDSLQVAESSQQTAQSLSINPATQALGNKSLIKLYGSSAWASYVQQPAAALINLPDQQHDRLTGSGVIAVIDTGVDPLHPVLASSLLPGYDFTRDISGTASEWNDLNQSTAAILEQSTAAILEQQAAVQLNQSTVAILEQSTAAILEGGQVPGYFGHGTMVAGLVHLIAPTAQIMPLKAFHADGSANTSDIVRAIYYAADHGANVINMSFSMPSFSDEIMRALNYANRKGVVCVASVGNEAQTRLVYPAALGNVIGVASTSPTDQASSFTNHGADLVAVAAPGEGLITTYPGGHYAAVWGTSFSAALVSGGADLLINDLGQNATMDSHDARKALSQAVAITPDLGAGRIDLDQAVQYVEQLKAYYACMSAGNSSCKDPDQGNNRW